MQVEVSMQWYCLHRVLVLGIVRINVMLATSLGLIVSGMLLYA